MLRSYDHPNNTFFKLLNNSTLLLQCTVGHDLLQTSVLDGHHQCNKH
jgi:hypothetical protein